jgi:hypothetical protein
MQEVRPLYSLANLLASGYAEPWYFAVEAVKPPTGLWTSEMGLRYHKFDDACAPSMCTYVMWLRPGPMEVLTTLMTAASSVWLMQRVAVPFVMDRCCPQERLRTLRKRRAAWRFGAAGRLGEASDSGARRVAEWSVQNPRARQSAGAAERRRGRAQAPSLSRRRHTCDAESDHR